MILHLAGATIEFANFVNYNCHPLGDCYKQPTVHVPTCSHSLTIHLHLRSVQLIRLMHSQQCFSHVRSTPRQRGREDEILDLKVPTPPPPPTHTKICHKWNKCHSTNKTNMTGPSLWKLQQKAHHPLMYQIVQFGLGLSQFPCLVFVCSSYGSSRLWIRLPYLYISCGCMYWYFTSHSIIIQSCRENFLSFLLTQYLAENKLSCSMI